LMVKCDSGRLFLV